MKASKLFKFKNGEDYVYLTKFSVGEQHRGQFNFKAGFSSALEGDDINRDFTLHYVVVKDDNWDRFLDARDCTERLQLSHKNAYVQFKGDGYWSPPNTETFFNEHRTTVFFFAAIN